MGGESQESGGGVRVKRGDRLCGEALSGIFEGRGEVVGV